MLEYAPPRTIDPTPDKILARCKAIQATWSPEVEHFRQVRYGDGRREQDEPWQPPVYPDELLNTAEAV